MSIHADNAGGKWSVDGLAKRRRRDSTLIVSLAKEVGRYSKSGLHLRYSRLKVKFAVTLEAQAHARLRSHLEMKTQEKTEVSNSQFDLDFGFAGRAEGVEGPVHEVCSCHPRWEDQRWPSVTEAVAEAQT